MYAGEMATMMCLVLEAHLAMKNDGPRVARPRRQKFSDTILPRDIVEHLLSQHFSDIGSRPPATASAWHPRPPGRQT
jgi:hypothetical protein